MKKSILLLPFFAVTALLLVAATGSLFRGKFVGGGHSPDFIGDGGGLTNLASTNVQIFQTNVQFNSTSFFNSVVITNNMFLSGKATFTSNVFLNSLSLSTNQASVNVLNLNCTEQGLSTNNNVLYSGFNIPVEFGVTNGAWAAVIVTNNSALPFIQIFFAGCIGDTNIFVTNQSAFTVKKFGLMGTNVIARNLK